MTFWAKFLTVLVFVLSIVFASASAVLFAKRQDYRAQLQEEQQQHQEDVRQLGGKLAKTEGQLGQRIAELQDAHTVRKSQQLEIQARNADVSETKAELVEWKRQFAQQQDLAKKLAVDIGTLTGRNDKLMGENENLRGENRGLLAKLGAEQSRANTLEKENADLKNEQDDLQVRLATAEDTIRLNEDVFTELAMRNIEARPIIESLTAMLEVHGKVMTVDPKNNVVILNVGRNQGVKKNYTFTVYRKDNFVAMVHVFDLQDNLCAANVVRVRPELSIQRGDNAATRLR